MIKQNITIGLFQSGELDSNKPFKASKTLSEEEFLNIFNVEKIKPLLKYKQTKFGSTWIADMPFFPKRIYLKYGEQVGWKDGY